MGVPLISDKSEITRIKTYIEGLDEVMQGGMPKGSVVLLSGVSGTMKSSVAFSTLFYNALEKKNCVSFKNLFDNSTTHVNLKPVF